MIVDIDLQDRFGLNMGFVAQFINICSVFGRGILILCDSLPFSMFRCPAGLTNIKKYGESLTNMECGHERTVGTLSKAPCTKH